MMEWISVEDVPISDGDWLVLVEDGKMHVAHIRENLSVVGGYFSFDMPKITHYHPLPEPPERRE